MARRRVTSMGFVADPQARSVLARFVDEEGRVYEVEWTGARVVEAVPPTPEAEMVAEPTTGRKERHRLPGALRPGSEGGTGLFPDGRLPHQVEADEEESR